MLIPITPAVFDTYKIVDIDRVSVFAGRQGNEVRENWTVEAGGHRYTVTVSPYHTHVARTPAAFQVGETVRISGSMHGDHIRTSISEVKR